MIEWVVGDVLATMDVVLKVECKRGDSYHCKVGSFVDDRVVYSKKYLVIMSGEQLVDFLAGDCPDGLIEVVPVQQMDDDIELAMNMLDEQNSIMKQIKNEDDTSVIYKHLKELFELMKRQVIVHHRIIENEFGDTSQ